MCLSLYLHLLHLTDKEKIVLHVFNSKRACFLTLLNICLLVLERAAAGLGSAFDIDREGDTEPALALFLLFPLNSPDWPQFTYGRELQRSISTGSPLPFSSYI